VNLKKFFTLVFAPIFAISLLGLTPVANAEEEETTTTSVEEVPAPLGLNPLTEVLNVSEFGFDKNAADFDILTALVLDVMGQRANTPVVALSDGNVSLTAFIPTDRAFRKLVKALTGVRYAKERKVYNAIYGLGMETVEKVLLYHVVLGDPVLSSVAVTLNNVAVPTALGPTVKVIFTGSELRLRDKDRDRVNPQVILSRVDLNAGNRQVAHPINGVLLPKL
jgi:uncharacterized surface protein with fasciclin (FAS1) repeats